MELPIKLRGFWPRESKNATVAKAACATADIDEAPTLANKVLNQVLLLPVDRIDPNPAQPRKSFAAESLEELAQSIEENGLLQPVTVRASSNGRFELVAGERRLRAFRLLGRAEIPAIVETFDVLSSRTLALIENLQRDDLDFFEQAAAIGELMQEHGFSQSEVARRIGLAQSTVANKLRILRLDEETRAVLLNAGLSERHARCLLLLEGAEKQIEAARQIVARGLNVAQAERYIETLLEEQKKKPIRLFVPKDVRIFINTIQKAVETMKQAGICACTQREEDDECILVTVRIPKSKSGNSSA